MEGVILEVVVEVEVEEQLILELTVLLYPIEFMQLEEEEEEVFKEENLNLEVMEDMVVELLEEMDQQVEQAEQIKVLQIQD